MSWFPQEYAHEWFAVICMLALTATCLLLFHMSRAWPTFVTKGQRLRYLSLLYAVVLTVVAAAEQYQRDADVQVRNLGTLGFMCLVLYAIYVSLAENDGKR